MHHNITKVQNDLPTRSFHCSSAYNNQLYIYGGISMFSRNEFLQYDSKLNEFFTLPIVPNIITGTLVLRNQSLKNSAQLILFGDSKLWQYEIQKGKWKFLSKYKYRFEGYSSVYDCRNDRMIVHGGLTNTTYFYHFRAGRWSKCVSCKDRTVHRFHCAIMYRDSMVVINLNTVWKFDKLKKWEQLICKDQMYINQHSSADVIGDRIYVLCRKSLYHLNMNTLRWTSLPMYDNRFGTRIGHTLTAIDDSTLILYGGSENCTADMIKIEITYNKKEKKNPFEISNLFSGRKRVISITDKYMNRKISDRTQIRIETKNMKLYELKLIIQRKKTTCNT